MAMLPTNSAASSIQRRRQMHRRQQSLEAPILAPPLPANPRRTNSTRLGHRRGLSLDQSVGAARAFTGARPLMPQDTHGLLPARTQFPDTTTNLPPEKQPYIKQEPQEHSLAQPGYQQPPPPPPVFDFQSHLHQQLNGVPNPTANPAPPNQVVAMQNLHNHLMWYQQNFGVNLPTPNLQNSTLNQAAFSVGSDMNPQAFMSQQSMPGMPLNMSMSQGASQTVPSTPQHQSWPSPPPSQAKRTRSHSYQLDVAPMPGHFGAAQAQVGSFQDNSYATASQLEQEYAGSAYSSSIADASSPSQQHTTPLPTLFEEDSPRSSGVGPAEDLLLQAAAGAVEPDFNDPNFIVGGGLVCPEQQALDAAGIDATYIDTGISEDELNSWLVHPIEKNDPYTCKWAGCKATINRKENARSHVQNHLDDRRFQCNPCGKRFSRMHDTKRHFLTHTQERPAVCPCGKSFARADALTRHRQRDMCAGVLPGFEKAEEDRPKRGRPKKDRSAMAHDDDDDDDDDDDRAERSRKRNRRPGLEERSKKAALARAIDRANANSTAHVASSTSAYSDASMPDTPPHDSDALDTTDYFNLDGASDHFTNAGSHWIDTPPTSPPSSSPTKAVSSRVYLDLTHDDGLDCISPAKLSDRSSPDGHSPFASQHDELTQGYSSPLDFNHATTSFNGGSSPIDDSDDVFNYGNVMDSHPNVGQDAWSPPGSESSPASYYSDWDSHVPNETLKPIGGIASHPILSGEPVVRQTYGEIDDDFLHSTGSQQPFINLERILDSWMQQN